MYVVVVLEDDGSSYIYGPWRNLDKARKVFDAALDATEATYDEVDIRLARVERWPGLRAWKASRS